MTALLIIAAWASAGITIAGAWLAACAWYDLRAARRNRRGGYLR